MKVLLVSSGSGSRGGGEIYLAVLAKELAAHGCEVIALVPEAENMDELAAAFDGSATVERFPFKPTYQRYTRTVGAVFDRGQQSRVSKLFWRISPDVVHVNQQVAEDGVDLVLAAQATGLPWLSTIHVARSAASLGATFGTSRDRFTIAVLRSAGGPYVAVSKASRAQLATRFGANAPRLAVVHNGVTAPDPAALAAARDEARADWGVDANAIVIGAVGRIEQQKDPLALVDYVAPLVTQAEVRLAWIGDGKLRGAFAAHASAQDVPLVIDGWRPDAATRLAGLDIFLLPSRFEGLPLAVLEAMHAGLPIIAARSDGIVEAIEDDVTGFTCSTPDEWRQATLRLATDPALRERLGTAASKAASERFSASAMARATLALYREICPETGPLAAHAELSA